MHVFGIVHVEKYLFVFVLLPLNLKLTGENTAIFFVHANDEETSVGLTLLQK